MDEEYVYKGEITNEVIRKWAYDENMLLLEQDEDLVAGDREFFPALFEAAEDPECPKGGYAISIMDFYLMFQILKGDDSSIPIVEEAIEYCEKSNDKEIKAWKAILEKRILYKKGIGEVDKATALEMGQILLNGICRSSDISIADETCDEWVVELSVPPFHRHKERIYIDKTTGKFKSKVSNGGKWL